MCVQEEKSTFGFQPSQPVAETKLTLKDYAKAFGPGAIMAAAIIGPGTVTTAVVTGATYQYASLWIIVMAVVLAYFFQEPAIRIALNKHETVMEGIRKYISPTAAKFLYLAILMGSIAFQAGNFAGAGMAMNYLVPSIPIVGWDIIMMIIALGVAWFGVYRIIENINKVLIGLMVFAFVICAFGSRPDVGQLITEGFSFQIPGNNYWLMLALIGTTMTPNLVLAYSSFLKKKYASSKVSFVKDKEKKLLSMDLGVNMFMTILVTGAIVVCAGATISGSGVKVKNAAMMASILTPILGQYAGVLFSLGLWAAAISSALYQISLHPMLFGEATGRSQDTKSRINRILMVLASVLPILIIVFSGSSPIELIVAAQALNGMALPLTMGLLWILCNKKQFMQDQVNSTKMNIIHGVMFVVVSFLAIRTFLSIFKLI